MPSTAKLYDPKNISTMFRSSNVVIPKLRPAITSNIVAIFFNKCIIAPPLTKAYARTYTDTCETLSMTSFENIIPA